MKEVVYSLIVMRYGEVIHTSVFRNRADGDRHLLEWLKGQYSYYFSPVLDDLDTALRINSYTLDLEILYRTEPVL